LSFYSGFMIIKQCVIDPHIMKAKLIPPHPSGGITKKPSESDAAGGCETKQNKNSQPLPQCCSP
jgi:hypothetical protein